jgi:hypothetical protein
MKNPSGAIGDPETGRAEQNDPADPDVVDEAEDEEAEFEDDVDQDDDDEEEDHGDNLPM